MIDGEGWKTGADAPTPQDIIKFAATKDKLLVELPWHPFPQEIRVGETANNGELFKASTGGLAECFGGGQWYRTNDVRILAILPPPAPTPRFENFVDDFLTTKFPQNAEANKVQKKRKKKK